MHRLANVRFHGRQVQYVLSDKTGTLTQNVMGFVWASVGGTLYGKNLSPYGTRCAHRECM